MQSLVVVEDEADIADLLALYFRREGWTVHVCGSGEEAVEVIRARQPAFVILDVGLPGAMDGFDVCRELRGFSTTPVLFLTARDDEVDRILGLELGADDYVTKPFSPREVVARVKAIQRRGERAVAPATIVAFDSVLIDRARQEVRVEDAPVALATQEFALLSYLLDNQGQVLSRDQILRGAWGEHWVGDARTVDVHVRQLRRKLGDDLPITTVRGVGYRLA